MSEPEPAGIHPATTSLPDAPSATLSIAIPSLETSLPCCSFNTGRDLALIERVQPRGEREAFNTQGAMSQVLSFLSLQHAARLLQPKTRKAFGGPFFKDWLHSIEGVQGWGDGDGIATNYFMHPMEGGIASFIYIQNSPSSRRIEFDLHSSHYWKSRFKAMAFAAAYSTQFEIGPYSEGTIGNVGLKPGTSGYVDFIMTPLGGLGFAVLEDYLDHHYIEPQEEKGISAAKRRTIRMLLNPERSLANVLRGRVPWYRDTR